MGNPFAEDTKVVAVEPNRYEANIREAWNLRPLPQGGFVTALALRAMADALGDPAQRLRTLHTAFVTQVAQGPVTIDVELLRRGRSMSHLRAEVMNTGAARGHVTTAIFGSTRPGFAFTDLEPPAGVPVPAECPSFRDPPPVEWASGPMPFWDELVESRPALGHAPWEDYVPDRAERAMWYRFDDPPFLDDGTLDPLAVVVLADTMPGAVFERIGPTEQMWFSPSIDLTVHLLDVCRSACSASDGTAAGAAPARPAHRGS
jgi:acyl-CoA thioesterase